MLRPPLADGGKDVGHHLSPWLHTLLAFAVDSPGDGIGLLLALADDKDVMDAGVLGALDVAHESVVAESHFGADLLGAQLVRDAIGVVNLRLGHA